jgi:hypothetical protein
LPVLIEGYAAQIAARHLKYSVGDNWLLVVEPDQDFSERLPGFSRYSTTPESRASASETLWSPISAKGPSDSRML